MAGGGEECPADDAGPQCVVRGEAPREIDHAEFVRVAGDVVNRLPSAGDEMEDGEEANDGAGNVDGKLDDVGPDYRGHSTFKGVDEGEQSDDGDGGDVALVVAEAGQEASQCYPDDDGYGEDPHAFGSRAGNQK